MRSTRRHLFDCEGFPRGWFVVGFSGDLAPGDVHPVKYFGQHLVLFRTGGGDAKMLDAYCPHLGAHLGHGGVVEGEDIKCPFHAWKFDGAGECTEVPYAEKIPPKAKVPCWPVCEVNGMIHVWHDPDGAAPAWEVPVMTEYGAAGWTEWDHSVLEIATHPHAIVENVSDTGHFIPVHGTHVDSFENVFDGHRAIQINSGVAYPLGGGEDRYSLRATYYGPGFQITEMAGFLNSRIVNAHTPVDEGTVLLRYGVLLERGDDLSLTEAFSAKYIENLREGFLQDVRLWEHKTFLERPGLCDGDGPIMTLRRWYAQFYEPTPPIEETVSA